MRDKVRKNGNRKNREKGKDLVKHYRLGASVRHVITVNAHGLKHFILK